MVNSEYMNFVTASTTAFDYEHDINVEFRPGVIWKGLQQLYDRLEQRGLRPRNSLDREKAIERAEDFFLRRIASEGQVIVRFYADQLGISLLEATGLTLDDVWKIDNKDVG